MPTAFLALGFWEMMLIVGPLACAMAIGVAILVLAGRGSRGESASSVDFRPCPHCGLLVSMRDGSCRHCGRTLGG